MGQYVLFLVSVFNFFRLMLTATVLTATVLTATDFALSSFQIHSIWIPIQISYTFNSRYLPVKPVKKVFFLNKVSKHPKRIIHHLLISIHSLSVHIPMHSKVLVAFIAKIALYTVHKILDFH